MKKLLTLLVLICFAYITPAVAQNYESAAGIRGGTGATISYKNFLGQTLAMEGILGSFDYDFFGTAILLEKHIDANLGRLQWYWGLGPYLTFAKNFTGFGAMGALGADISFGSLPINISLDWTPRFRLSGAKAKLFGASAGVGIRYIINY